MKRKEFVESNIRRLIVELDKRSDKNQVRLNQTGDRYIEGMIDAQVEIMGELTDLLEVINGWKK